MDKSEEKKLGSNIWKLNSIIGLKNLMFWIPIIALFFLDNGLTLTQIMILESVFALGVLVLEIPSGFFADIFGRKLSIILNAIFYIAAMYLLAIGDNFFIFAIAEILCAIGYSLLSGADSAFLYDTLVELKRENEYKKREGNLRFISLICNALASLTGGFIAAFLGFRYNFYLIIPFIFIALIFSLTLTEPKRHIKIHEKGYIYHLYKITRFTLYKNKEVQHLSFYSALLAGLGIIGFWFYQPYMNIINIPIVYFGIIFACLNVVAALSSKFAFVFENIFKKAGSLILIGLLLTAGFFLLGKIAFLFSIIFIFLLQFSRGLSEPIIKDYINKITWSDKRATVLSIQSMLGRLFFVVFSPFLGMFADKTSVPNTFTLMGAISFLCLGIVLISAKINKVI